MPKFTLVLSFIQVQMELRQTTEERNRLLVELQEKTAKLEEQIGMTSLSLLMPVCLVVLILKS